MLIVKIEYVNDLIVSIWHVLILYVAINHKIQKLYSLVTQCVTHTNVLYGKYRLSNLNMLNERNNIF